MSKSRVEIDFQRLLNKCKQLVPNYPNNAWRLDKYVEALEDMLNQLDTLNFLKPSREELIDYHKQVKYLKGLIHVDKLVSPSEKLMATQLLSPTVSALQSNNTVNSDSVQLHFRSKSRYLNEARKQLFNDSEKEAPSTDADVLLKENDRAQERIAEEMVLLARNLKQNCMTANSIIKQDTQQLEKTSNLAEKNFSNLRTNNERLSDFVRRSCQYWLWIMLAVVALTFLWIIVFIRLFPKK